MHRERDRDRARTSSSPALPGVFATVAAAFTLLLASPLPMLLPAAVDLWLWRAPRISPEGVAEPLAALLAASPNADTRLADAIVRWGQTGDMAAIVGWFVPSLLAGLDVAPMAGLGERAVLQPGGASIPLAIVMLLLAAFGVMTFKTMLARVIAGQRVLDAALPSEAWRNGLRYLAFLGLAAGAVVAIAVPVAAALALLGVMGVNLLPLFALAASMAVFAGAILLAFVGEAIVLRGAGPWQAVRLSAGVVQRHTASTAGLLVVLWVALVSLPPLLASIAFNALGVALAIAVYAFTATGLALARMLFVRDRLPDPAARPDAP